ncbi:MAG: TetR/AcrR family transcriptional regulator [Neptuniibacter sp.]
MPKPTPDSKEIQKRIKEIIIATRNILSYEDFNQLTIDQISEQVSISKGSIYNIFNNKEEILMYMANSALRELLKKLKASIKEKLSPEENIINIAENYIDYMLNNNLNAKIILYSKKPFLNIDDETSKKELTNKTDALIIDTLSNQITKVLESKNNINNIKKTTNEICFTIWSISYGIVSLYLSPSNSLFNFTDTELKTIYINRIKSLIRLI